MRREEKPSLLLRIFGGNFYRDFYNDKFPPKKIYKRKFKNASKYYIMKKSK